MFKVSSLELIGQLVSSKTIAISVLHRQESELIKRWRKKIHVLLSKKRMTQGRLVNCSIDIEMIGHNMLTLTAKILAPAIVCLPRNKYSKYFTRLGHKSC